MAQVFDIVLNTYSDYVSELYWVVGASGSELPKRIQLKANSTSANKVFAIAKADNSKRNGVSVLNQSTGLNELFLVSLKKMYGSLSNTSSLFKSECRNFASITSKENWVEEVSKILDVNVESCYSESKSIGSEPLFSWAGSDTATNKSAPLSASGTYNASKAASYVKAHSLAKSQHKCAAYVRDAITNANGGTLQLQSYPVSACRYIAHLPKWGFKVVHQGVAGDNFNDYKQGDISVVAGMTNGQTSIHGHIQIYGGDGWYSDYKDSKAWCYSSPNGRPYVVFRFGS
jgi:hypothetical protein